MVLLSAGCASYQKEPATSAMIAPDMQKAAKNNAALAIIYSERGMLDRAREKLMKAESQDGNLVEVYYARGYYYQKLEFFKLAEKAYRQALIKAPDNDEALNFYAQFLCRYRHEYGEAEKLFRRSVFAPDNTNLATTFLLWGQCELIQNKPDEAELLFKKSIAQGGKNSEAYWHLAQIYAEKGQNEQALKMLNDYIARVGESRESLKLKITLLNRLGRSDEAAALRLQITSDYYRE